MEYFLITLLGLEFGSFANACIYRWPLNMSILYPQRSFCPWCKKKIHWWHNIPLFSYFSLHGKCPECRSEISMQYPIVEACLPVLWILYFFLLKNIQGISIVFVTATFLLLFAVVVSTVTDLNWRIIPDQVVVLVFVISLLVSLWNPILNSDGNMAALTKSLLGAFMGGGLLLFLSQMGRFLFEREALGWGDIKLMTAYGAFLGAHNIVLVLFFGSILGAVLILIGMFMGKVKRYQYIPFAPFLNLGCLIVLFKTLIEL